MKSWKTSLLGVVGGLLMLFGPARLQGDKTAPPINLINVGQAAAVALLGVFAKDHDVTGGTRPNA